MSPWVSPLSPLLLGSELCLDVLPSISVKPCVSQGICQGISVFTYFLPTLREASHTLVRHTPCPSFAPPLLWIFALPKNPSFSSSSPSLNLLTKLLLSTQPPVATSSPSEVLCDSLNFRNNPLSYLLTLLGEKMKCLRHEELWSMLRVSDKPCVRYHLLLHPWHWASCSLHLCQAAQESLTHSSEGSSSHRSSLQFESLLLIHTVQWHWNYHKRCSGQILIGEKTPNIIFLNFWKILLQFYSMSYVILFCLSFFLFLPFKLSN